MTHTQLQFTPISLADVNLVDPKIALTHTGGLSFKLSAKSGVGAWTWLDHPAGTVGYFADTHANVPLNGFYLVPGRDSTGAYFLHWHNSRWTLIQMHDVVKFVLNQDLSSVKNPAPADFVVRSLWNNTHV